MGDLPESLNRARAAAFRAISALTPDRSDPEAAAYLNGDRGALPGYRPPPARAPLVPVSREHWRPGPGMPLPRQSELPARMAMLEQMRPPQPPPMPIGPGGITGEDQPPPRVRFSDVAEPDFFSPFMPRDLQPMTPPAFVDPSGGPLSPATFEPGTGQPPAPQPHDDLDVAWGAALTRARMAQTGRGGVALRKPTRRDPPRRMFQ